MNTQAQIVVAYDFTANARTAAVRAIARARLSRAVLHFLCVVEPHGTILAVPRQGPVDFAYVEKVQKELAQDIASELALAEISDPLEFFAHVRIGKPVEEILRLAAEVGADAIVLGTRGHTGLQRYVLGSVAERVVREAGCPVEVVREKRYEHVELQKVTEVKEPHHAYVPPHRYSYEARQLQMRPSEWPIY